MTKIPIDEVVWSSEQQVRGCDDRRKGVDRRQFNGRSITVPDMRTGVERRHDSKRKNKIRITITGRAMNA